MKYKINNDIYFIPHSQDVFLLLFNWLFSAISLVKKGYLEFNDSKGENVYHKERVFAYELYRQWANILDREHVTELTLNAELDKVIGAEISYDGINSNYKPIIRYPDMVLHSGQGNNKKQRIVCEIKHNTKHDVSKASIFADLYKLTLYLDENEMGKSKYDYGVFILLNGRFSQIRNIKSKIIVEKKEINYNEFKKVYKEFFNRIICVIYDGETLEYKTLKSVFTNNI